MKHIYSLAAQSNYILRCAAFAYLLFLVVPEGAAQDIPEGAVLVVFQSNGNVAPAYRDAFRDLVDRAEREGYLPTWIRLQFDYNPDLQPETQEFTQQADVIKAAEATVMAQLGLDDDDYLGSTAGAPYFAALLTAKQLRDLGQTRRVWSFYGLPPSTTY
jgi:hypothetical protein